MKVCTKCGESKSLTDFNKQANKRDGLQSQCRSCQKTAAAKYYLGNREKRRVANTKWRDANRDKHKAAIAAWQVANREKHLAAKAKHYAANSEKHKAANAKWRAANTAARRIYAQNRRARKRAAGGQLSKGLAERLVKLQRGKCACCRKPLGADYHLDHILPIALGGTNTDDNIQLLRQRCNNQKCAKHPVDFMQQRGHLL